MRQQHSFIPTLREIPADAEAKSHKLMLRAGLIRQVVSGVYAYLPVGQKVLLKVQTIIREEMAKAGAEELFLPSIQPEELFKESGRWDYYGDDLMKLRDRHDRDFVLGPTHEELITNIVKAEVKSYKKLPMCMYQIQTKFRDEKRPRYGVLRSREFIMKDAYSFHASEECLDYTYRKIYNSYVSFFERCGLNFRAVEADSGAMGGTDTHEFMILTDVGEDTIVYSNESNYAANIEKAPVITRDYDQIIPEHNSSIQEVNIPGISMIKELVTHLNVDAKHIIKSVAFDVKGQPVIVLVRGDYDVNETKVKNIFGVDKVDLLSDERIMIDCNSVPGYLGPIGIKDVKIISDYSVKGMIGAIVGANKSNKHLLHVTPDIDFKVDSYHDIRNIVDGDPSPCGHGTVQFTKGIEVGHIFKLGKKYSSAFKATFINKNGKEEPYIMGCYGIGITRLVAAIIEQNHDEFGIIWPKTISPFDVHLITLNPKNNQQNENGEKIYKKLQSLGYTVLYDDRQERPGVKFSDSDLIGIPCRIIVGNKAEEGIFEVKSRKTGEVHEISVEELQDFINNI